MPNLFNVFYCHNFDTHPEAAWDGPLLWHGYAGKVSRELADEMVDRLLRLGYHTMIESV